MNWGKGIILVLVIFILFITGMSIKFFLLPVDDYDHQYYENGLNFDHDYNREKQVVTDHAAPSIRITNQKLLLIFTQPVAGNIRFLRPSDTALDRTFKLEGKEIEIPLKTIPAGQWQLVINWENNHKAYLFHKEVYIK